MDCRTISLLSTMRATSLLRPPKPLLLPFSVYKLTAHYLWIGAPQILVVGMQKDDTVMCRKIIVYLSFL